jgi:hypothetical protein
MESRAVLVKKVPRKRPRFLGLKIVMLLLRSIKLFLLNSLYKNSKRIANRAKRLLQPKEIKLKQVKVTDQDERIPPMPDRKEDITEGSASSSPLTSGRSDEPTPAVSEALAGDLIALPFDGWHLIQPCVDPLSEEEKSRLAGPFARILEKYGMGKIAKDEILLGFYLTAVVYGRIKAIREEKKKEKIQEVVEH